MPFSTSSYLPGDWGFTRTIAKNKKIQPLPQPAPAWAGPTWVPQPVAPQYNQNPYAGLLNAYANQQRADAQGQSVADQASRDAAIKRFLVSYGEVPDFNSLGVSDAAKGVLGGLGGDVRDLAAKNTAEGTSVKARLDQANLQAQRKIPATLAGRGLLHSGQTGYDLGQQGMQNKQAQFDVLNEMLGNIEGAVSQYSQAEAARQRQLADAEQQAAMAAMQDYGGGMYGDQGGGYWDYSGQPTATQSAAKAVAAKRVPVKQPVKKAPVRSFGGNQSWGRWF